MTSAIDKPVLVVVKAMVLSETLSTLSGQGVLEGFNVTTLTEEELNADPAKIQNLPPPLTVFIGPRVGKKAALASLAVETFPQVQVVVSSPHEEQAALRVELSRSLAGQHCWPVSIEDKNLKKVFQDAARLTMQRRQFRTTLDHLNVHIAAPRTPDLSEVRKLAVSDKFLASILTHAQDAILSADAEGTILAANGAAKKWFGQDFTGRLLAELPMNPKAAEAVRHQFDDVINGRRTERKEISVPLNGQEHFLEVSVASVFDDANGIIGASAIFRDVTQRKRNEMQLANQKEALEQIVRGVPLEDILETLTENVERFIARSVIATILLMDADEQRLRPAAGKHSPRNWNEFINPLVIGPEAGSCGTAAHRGLRVIVADIQTDPLWAAYKHEAGRHGLRSCWSTPILSSMGKVLGTFAIYSSEPSAPTAQEMEIVDVATRTAAIAIERKQSEEALLQSRADLEQRVEERTRELNQTISELEAFSYSVSHDLRAPVRAIQSYARLLLTDFAANIPGEGKDYLERITRSAHRLDRLMQDVLSYSRISREPLVFGPVPVEKLVRETIEQYPLLQSPAAEITIRSPLHNVVAHESSLTQCLSNVLTNAVKFVRPGVPPKVTIWSERHGAKTRLWIEDNGIGIRPADRDRIFEMFVRVNPAKSFEGTGIGLAIVKKAIERMNGHLGVESDLEHGTRFWIELPAA